MTITETPYAKINLAVDVVRRRRAELSEYVTTGGILIEKDPSFRWDDGMGWGDWGQVLFHKNTNVIPAKAGISVHRAPAP